MMGLCGALVTSAQVKHLSQGLSAYRIIFAFSIYCDITSAFDNDLRRQQLCVCHL